MKQAEVKPAGDASTVPAATTGQEPNANETLEWVDEVAALLPEESRLGWYQNVRPWLRMLPPDDEIAHLAYSMGYLALLTRSTPALMAAERAKMAAMLHRLTDEMTGTLTTIADYHQKLNDRLTALPAEIARGVNPTALAAQLVAGVREQFMKCGIPEAGRLLREKEKASSNWRQPTLTSSWKSRKNCMPANTASRSCSMMWQAARTRRRNQSINGITKCARSSGCRLDRHG